MTNKMRMCQDVGFEYVLNKVSRFIVWYNEFFVKLLDNIVNC